MRVCEAPACGGSLEGRRSTARFCDDACRERAKRARGGARTGVIGRPREREYEVDENGCWNWLLATNRGGYGLVCREGRTRIAHVWFWVQQHGPVPEGRELHHRCENERCVNPEHLEPLTRAEHVAVHA